VAASPPAGRLPAAARRRQLLDVARLLFAERGFHDTSVQELADRAGVTKPVVYQHFQSKRALFLELLRATGGELLTAVEEATSTAATPHAQVVAGFQAYFHWVAATPGGFDVVFSGEARRDPEFLAEVMAAETGIADAIARHIAVEGLGAEHRRLLAYGIVGIAETTCRHWLAADLAADADELARQTAELAWAGLRGLRP
jgi:AcrR family transcriptional regulator